MMHHQLLYYILHGIGFPLVDAIIKAGIDDEDKATDVLVNLLEQIKDQSDAVQDLLGIPKENMEDSLLRLHIAGLTSKMITATYAHTKKLPGQNDLKRALSAVSALQVFVEQYLPEQKLSDIYPEKKADSALSTLTPRNFTQLSSVEHAIPLADAITKFSFGQTEQVMMQDVSKKLRARAKSLGDEYLAHLVPDAQQKEGELIIVKALFQLYSDCHMREIDRISELSMHERDNDTSETQIKNIWSQFELHLELLCVMIENMMPETVQPLPEEPDDFAFIEDMLDDSELFQESEISEDESQSEDTDTTTDTTKGPMGFYKKA